MLAPLPVYAQCTSPAGVAGENGYNLTGSGEMEYCDGSSWISMNNSSVTIGATLVGHWKLDETTATTTAADSSGYGNDGTMTGMTGSANTVTAKVSTGLDFDGSTDYIEVLGNPSEYQITGSISAAAWVKADSWPEIKHIVSKQGNGGASNNYGWRLATSGGSSPFNFGVSETGATMIDRRSATIPEVGKWYHVAGVYDASSQTIDIYINGQLDNGTLTGTVPSSQNDSSVNVFIGRRSGGGRFFDGIIDDVRIYDNTLNASDIAILSICTKPGELGYDFANHVLLWCDDNLDAYTTGTAGAGGGGCAASGSKAAGVEGTMQYDTANNKMVFCDGANWVDIPN